MPLLDDLYEEQHVEKEEEYEMNLASTSDDTVIMPMIRVAIVTPHNIVDVALPAQMPIYEIIPSLENNLLPKKARAGIQQLRLASMHGEIFHDDASLDSLGIIDGDMLLIQSVPLGETASPVIEDIAQAAIIESSDGQVWTLEWLRVFFITGFLLLSLCVGLSLYILSDPDITRSWRNFLGQIFQQSWVGNHTFTSENLTHQFSRSWWIPRLVYAAITLNAGFFTCTLSKRISDDKQKYVILSALVTFLLAIAAQYIFLENQPLMVHTVVCATLGFLWAVLLLIVNPRWSIMWTAQLIVSAVLAVLAALTQYWHYDGIVFCVLTLTIGFILMSTAGSLATLCARFPLAYLPAPTEPLPPVLTTAQLQTVPAKVRHACAYSQGIIAAAVILITGGAIVGVFTAHASAQSHGALYVLIVITTCSSVHRQRLWQLPWAKQWLIMTPYWVTLGIGLTSYTSIDIMEYYGIAFAYIMIIHFLYLKPSLYDPHSYPIILRRAINLVIFLADCLLIPLALYIVGVFPWALHH